MRWSCRQSLSPDAKASLPTPVEIPDLSQCTTHLLFATRSFVDAVCRRAIDRRRSGSSHMRSVNIWMKPFQAFVTRGGGPPHRLSCGYPPARHIPRHRRVGVQHCLLRHEDASRVTFKERGPRNVVVESANIPRATRILLQRRQWRLVEIPA
jgi:hypothetical protein